MLSGPSNGHYHIDILNIEGLVLNYSLNILRSRTLEEGDYVSFMSAKRERERPVLTSKIQDKTVNMSEVFGIHYERKENAEFVNKKKHLGW